MLAGESLSARHIENKKFPANITFVYPTISKNDVTKKITNVNRALVCLQ